MPCVAHLMLVMLRLTPFVAHLMLVMVLSMPEQCSFQDLLFHLLFMAKHAEKSASRMDISLPITTIKYCSAEVGSSILDKIMDSYSAFRSGKRQNTRK